MEKGLWEFVWFILILAVRYPYIGLQDKLFVNPNAVKASLHYK